MCGFAGFIAPADHWPGRERAQGVLTAMREAIAHRGPDDAGLWIDDAAGAGLAFRRLSIIDLSEHGHQPMVSACGRYVMVFNGEIYNFQDLRAEAEAFGHTAWRGHSDSEAVLAHISLDGLEATLPRLSGMFAIAVWDRQARRLELARDRFGEKPLHYGVLGGQFAFASELGALRAHPGFQGRLNRQAAADFLRHGFIVDPLTIHDGLWSLPPGHRLHVEPGAAPRVTPYWDPARVLSAARARPFKGDAEEAAAELDQRIRAAVAQRMVADVPLGAFLSGGIDSSTVAASMTAAGGAVRTFTVAFPGTRFDESAHARAVADHLGSRHTEFTLTEADLRAVVPDLGRLYDQPFADPSQIPTVVLCRETRGQVTVALSGDGGDEMFGGYPRYRQIAARWAKARKQGPLRRAGVEALVKTLAGHDARPIRNLRKKLAERAGDDIDGLYRNAMSRWRPDEALTRPCPGEAAPTLWDAPLPPAGKALSDPRRLMLRDILTYLPADLLVKVDRASMAFGLEVRAPLLDHTLAEFVWGLPDALTVAGEGKALLRRVLARHVPARLFERPKQGFEPPLADWLRGDLSAWAEALLHRGDDSYEYYDIALVRRRWREHRAGVRNWTYPLWNVLMLEAWLDAQGR
ncbi:MAG: asparagine synthase (glutamine-hydrolyzing) [Caulobacteraceae bacterium]|nr:asparagine synthase (glutamine-hydrolyzing) [Caulobacteraceae bacterium]